MTVNCHWPWLGSNKLYISTVIGLGKGTSKPDITTVIGLGKGLISFISQLSTVEI
jgi:hypothetical protein